ncbi:hypothetical protein NDU88_004663, partial [Pleurodeles waltl]
MQAQGVLFPGSLGIRREGGGAPLGWMVLRLLRLPGDGDAGGLPDLKSPPHRRGVAVQQLG